MLKTPDDFYKPSTKISVKTKKKRCQIGQKRNKKTGLCEPK